MEKEIIFIMDMIVLFYQVMITKFIVLLGMVKIYIIPLLVVVDIIKLKKLVITPQY
jgi:hypothetical protein